MASCLAPHTFLSHPISSIPSPCSQIPPSQPPTPPSQTLSLTATPKILESSRKANVESRDLTSPALTRRFGLAAGIACAGFLAFGTRLEVFQEQPNTRNLDKEEEVILPNGIRYYELRVGGGATPRPGDLVVMDLNGSIKESGEVFVDTFGKNKRAVALVQGYRPYARGMCEGIECVVRTMKAGGKRRVIVPPNLGYGAKGTDFGYGAQIPPHATLEYIVEIENTSFATA